LPRLPVEGLQQDRAYECERKTFSYAHAVLV
jgi:hypothetical protein